MGEVKHVWGRMYVGKLYILLNIAVKLKLP